MEWASHEEVVGTTAGEAGFPARIDKDLERERRIWAVGEPALARTAEVDEHSNCGVNVRAATLLVCKTFYWAAREGMAQGILLSQALRIRESIRDLPFITPQNVRPGIREFFTMCRCARCACAVSRCAHGFARVTFASLTG